MIWIWTKEAMRTRDNPLVAEAMEHGAIGFVHVVSKKWTMRDVYEMKIAIAWREKMKTYNIPVVFVSHIPKESEVWAYGHQIERPKLVEWTQIVTGAGKPYQKFTPFYKKAKMYPFHVEEASVTWRKQEKVEIPWSEVDVQWPRWSKTVTLPLYREEDVLTYLETIDLSRYAEARDEIENEAVTRLSPYLSTGLVTSRTILAFGLKEEAFVRQLLWREFAHMTAWAQPHVTERPLYEKFQTFPWRDDEVQFTRWCRGETGYPIVDAAMRELWQTGYMHNRLRMITASFLTKHLRIDWRKGMKYFMETLVDADEASNALNWQWVAGVGVDSSPYFRIFNPLEQGKKYAASGTYIRTWCPKVQDVHREQNDAIVMHDEARKHALSHYEQWKQNNSNDSHII